MKYSRDELADFIRAWWSCKNMEEVVERTRMDRRKASQLAADLRRKLVPLKVMPNNGRSFQGPHMTDEDYAHLRRIAEHEASAQEMAKRYRSK